MILGTPFVRQAKPKSRPKIYSIRSHLPNGAPIFRFRSTNKSIDVPGVYIVEAVEHRVVRMSAKCKRSADDRRKARYTCRDQHQEKAEANCVQVMQ